MHPNLKQSQNSINNTIDPTFIQKNDNSIQKAAQEQNQSLINVYGMGTEMEKLYNSKADVPRSMFHNWQPSLALEKQDLVGRKTRSEQQKGVEMDMMVNENIKNVGQLIEIIVDDEQIKYEKKGGKGQNQRNESIGIQNKKQIVIQKNIINNQGNNNNLINKNNINNQNNTKLYIGDNGRKSIDQKLRANQQIVMGRTNNIGDIGISSDIKNELGSNINSNQGQFIKQRDNLKRQLSQNNKSNNNKVSGYLKAINSSNNGSGYVQKQKEKHQYQVKYQNHFQKQQLQQTYLQKQQQKQQHASLCSKHMEKQHLTVNPNNSLFMNSLYPQQHQRHLASNTSSLNTQSSNMFEFNHNHLNNPMYQGNNNNSNPYNSLQQTNHHLAYLYGLLDSNVNNNGKLNEMSKFLSINNKHCNFSNNMNNLPNKTPIPTPLYYKEPKLVTNTTSNQSTTIKPNNSSLTNNNLNEPSLPINSSNNPNKQTRDIVLGKKDRPKNQPQVIVLDSDQEQIIEEKNQNNTKNNFQKTIQQQKNDSQIPTNVPLLNSIYGNNSKLAGTIQQKPSILPKTNILPVINQYPSRLYSLTDPLQLQQTQSNFMTPLLNKYPNTYNPTLYDNSQLLQSMMKPSSTYYNSYPKPSNVTSNVGYIPTSSILPKSYSSSFSNTGKQYKQFPSGKNQMGNMQKTKHIQKMNNKHDRHHNKGVFLGNEHMNKIKQLCRQQQKGLSSLLLPQNNNLPHMSSQLYPQFNTMNTKPQLLFPTNPFNNINIPNISKPSTPSQPISMNFMESFTQQKIQNINSYLMKSWNVNNNYNISTGCINNSSPSNNHNKDIATKKNQNKANITITSINNKNPPLNIINQNQTNKQLINPTQSQTNKQIAGNQHIKRQAQKAFLKTRSRINSQNPTLKLSQQNQKKLQKKQKTQLNDYQKALINQLSTKLQSSNQEKDKINLQWTPRLKKLRELTKKRDYDSVILIGPDFQADIPKFITNQYEMRTIIAIKKAGLLRRLYKHTSQIQEKISI